MISIMRFDLTDLRLFLNIYEARTITGGAKRSHMTLASASERIKGMEAEVGIPLLLRTHLGVEPTPAGQTLLHHADAVLQQMDHLQSDLHHYGNGLKGHVRLLCNTSALSEYLPDILSEFLLRHSQVSIDIEERLSFEIADAIRLGRADIGIVADSANLTGLETYPFRSDPLALIVKKNHELAKHTSTSLSAVAGYAFIGLTEGSALQDHLAFHARRCGKHLHFRIRLRSIAAVCAMTGHGVGIAVVPDYAARRYARVCGIKRIALTDDWAQRSLVLCVRSRESLPTPAQQMIDHILGPPSKDVN